MHNKKGHIVPKLDSVCDIELVRPLGEASGLASGGAIGKLEELVSVGGLASGGAMGKLETLASAGAMEGGIRSVDGLASAGAIGNACISVPFSRSPTY